MISKQLTYRDRLKPWCIIRQLPNCLRLTIARFTRHPNAEAYLNAVQRLMPAVPQTIVFVNALCVNEVSVPVPTQLSIES